MNGATLQQVEKFKYLEVAIVSDVMQGEELDTRMGKTSAVKRDFHYLLAMKRELLASMQSFQYLKQFLSPFSPKVMNLG